MRQKALRVYDERGLRTDLCKSDAKYNREKKRKKKCKERPYEVIDITMFIIMYSFFFRRQTKQGK